MPASNVYPRFDPTSLFAGDYPKITRRVALPSGLNAAGSPLLPGVLLGQKTIAQTFSAAAAAKAGNTGNGTCTLGTPQTLANVMAGVYRVVFTAATTYQVYDPKGDQIGTGANGTAFGTQVKFTTAAGGTAFVAGDEFDITVTAAPGPIFSVASAATAGNTGNGSLTLASPAFLDGVIPGVYTVQLTSATTFQVFNPLGEPVGAGVVGTAFAVGVAFTLAAGGTAFVGGDSFSLTVSASALFIPCVQTATDGSQAPVAVLGEEADTSGGPVNAIAFFTGEFTYEQMTIDSSWPSMDAVNIALSAAGRSLVLRRVGLSA